MTSTTIRKRNWVLTILSFPTLLATMFSSTSLLNAASLPVDHLVSVGSVVAKQRAQNGSSAQFGRQKYGSPAGQRWRGKTGRGYIHFDFYPNGKYTLWRWNYLTERFELAAKGTYKFTNRELILRTGSTVDRHGYTYTGPTLMLHNYGATIVLYNYGSLKSQK